MKKYNSTSGNRQRRSYNFDFKIHIVQLVENNQISKRHASQKFDVPLTTLCEWCDKYGTMSKEKKNNQVSNLAKKLQEMEEINDFYLDIFAEIDQSEGFEELKKSFPESLKKEIAKRNKSNKNG